VTSSYPYPATEPSYRPTLPAGDPTAVMGRRVAAWVVDSIIVLAPSVALFTSDLEYLEESELDQSGVDFCEEYMDREEGVCLDAGDRVYFSEGVPVAPWAVAFGLAILINVLLQGLKGWTPGKLLFGIRTVAEDGRAPGIGRAIIRWLLFIVDDLCAGLVGFIVALTSKGHRRVGDMAAKTFVVGSQHMGSLIVVPGLTTGYPAYPGYPGYPGGPAAPGGSAAPGGPGGPGGWGAQPGPPGDQPQAWPPPTWGPAPTWGTPTETTPQETSGVESPLRTPAEAPSEPQQADQAAPTTEPRRAGVEPASQTPGRDAATTDQPRTEAPTTAETGTPGYNPQWDPARGTYIVWSAERRHWLGWDEAAKEWKPL
jgi:RDD family